MKDKTYYIIFIVGCIFIILAIIISIIFLLKEDEDNDVEPQKEDWKQYDSYIFSIYWPPSLCFNKMIEKEKCFSKVRELSIDDFFIIHGLWPTYISGKNIDYCNKNEEVNVTFNEEITGNNLPEVWPGLYSTNQITWNHEYNKHGYCYIQRIGKNPKTDYIFYFDKSSEIIKKYRLLMENILPDTPKGLHNITKKKFQEFISQSNLKLDPSYYSLICIRNDTENTNILNEIRINYDIDLIIIKSNKSIENCTDKFQIYFIDETKKPVYEKYDYYVFTVLWNPTSCKERGKECYKILKEKELNILMIHGLWPSYKKGRFPQWCNIDDDIQIEEFPEGLNYNMTNYWVGIDTTNKDFWNHEYNKHGYCYNQKINQDVSNYNFYFQKAVDIYHHYELKNLLKDFFPGIFAGENKLNKQYIEQKLDERFGIGTHCLSCIRYGQRFYLYEIRLKLDLEFNLTTDGHTTDNCPEEIYAEFMEVEGPQKQAEGLYETYDMYFFTILWLGTTCHMKGEQCYENIKVVPKNIFTLHGLWPNYRNGTLADWCNGKNDIEIDIQDENLLEFMNSHYISGYHTNAYFWEHEYNKHGYCYNQRNNLDPNNYEIFFKKAREMYLKYDFSNIFLDIYKYRIEPGDMEINRKEVQNYFEDKGFSKDTYLLVCTNITRNESTTVNPHLLEIRIRFNLDFNLLKNETDKSEFDCPEIFYAQFL